ncbi:MAG: glycosyltransferase [Acidimicrobiales bacterium]
MRVAMLSFHTSPLDQPGIGDSGGMNVYVRRLASSLGRLGVECDVFTRRTSPDMPQTIQVEPGFRVHHIDAGPNGHLPKEALSCYLSEFTDNVTEYIYKSTDDGIDLVHANYWLSGVAGHALKHEFGVPLFTTFHTLERAKALGRTGDDDLVDASERILAEHRIMGCSDAILVSCAPEEQWLSELYGIPRERVHVVPLGVDRAYFSPGSKAMARSACGLPRDGKIVLSVGRIQHLKGFPIALEAAIRAGDDVHFVLVGGPSGHDGERELRALEELRLGLGHAERVHILPPQPHETLSSLYRAADVVAVPSRTESFGLVALEAAACGRPVVAASVGGLTSLVDHEETGLLVEERTPAQFSAALRQVLDDPDVMSRMGARALVKVEQYTWRHCAQRLLSLYGDRQGRRLLNCG